MAILFCWLSSSEVWVLGCVFFCCKASCNGFRQASDGLESLEVAPVTDDAGDIALAGSAGASAESGVRNYFARMVSILRVNTDFGISGYRDMLSEYILVACGRVGF